MKYIIVCLLAIAFVQSPTEALLSSVVNGITNLVGGVVNTVTNTVSSGIDSVTNTINTVTLVSQFLWDNAVSPSLTVLQQNGVDFIDNYFGTILNAIGKRELQLSVENEKALFKGIFISRSTDLIKSLNEIFKSLISKIRTILLSSIQALTSGQVTIQELVADLFKQAHQLIQSLINQVTADLDLPFLLNKNLDSKLQPMVLNLKGIIETIGELAIDALNVIESTIFYLGSIIVGWFGK